MPSGAGRGRRPALSPALSLDGYSVISRRRAAISAALESAGGRRGLQRHQLGHVAFDATLPAMKACMPAWGLPSMRIALAVS